VKGVLLIKVLHDLPLVIAKHEQANILVLGL